MRTNINQGRIQSLAVMIVMLINNDQTPYLTYYRILGLTVHATFVNSPTRWLFIQVTSLGITTPDFAVLLILARHFSRRIASLRVQATVKS